MTPKNIALTALMAAQAVAMPLMLGRSAQALSASAWALILLAVVLAAAVASTRPWPLLAALPLAVIGAWGSPTLLPLALAQVGLAWLLTTQQLGAALTTTGWLTVAAFLQLLMFARLDQVLTQATLLAVLAVTLPAVAALWARPWPLWLLILVQAVLAVATVWLQVFTLPTAAVLLVGGILLDPRLRKSPAWAYSAFSLLLALLNVYTQFHG
ncbi:hypothetical protein [Lacticaseibacillus kribbianus]|uniref:hypothetical protein n=1 Tax=Lacticaseibacillus kribbianus TaxID=2926292 RepID=UPI001CD2AC80|nr:hypothetical protein [Lacticaseibacillus kribbianus]